MKQETKLSIITVVLLLCAAYFSLPLWINAIDHELDKNDATAVRHNGIAMLCEYSEHLHQRQLCG